MNRFIAIALSFAALAFVATGLSKLLLQNASAANLFLNAGIFSISLAGISSPSLRRLSKAPAAREIDFRPAAR